MMIRKSCRLMPALALVLAIVIPNVVNAQGKQVVTPFVDVQGKPGNKVVGLTPAQIRTAYGFNPILNRTQGGGQTIAVVSGFFDPNLAGDVTTFSNQFGLPAADIQTVYSCTYGTGPAIACKHPAKDFPAVDQTNPFYQVWALETAMDVEWAHAIAPAATIVVVAVQPTGCIHVNADGSLSQCSVPPVPGDYPDPTLDDLLGGVDVVLNSTFKPGVVSMSWGGTEFSGELLGPGGEDQHFQGHNYVTFFASAGDSGHGVIYPAASPYVMSVGGTRLNVDSNGNYASEKAWNGTGGGQSQFESEPAYQSNYPIPKDPSNVRGTPDVAYDAAPGTGVAVFDSVPFGSASGWSQVGGTSAGPPQWSALFALANALRAPLKRPLTGTDGDANAVLYTVAQDTAGNITFHDVSNGKDGSCGSQCKAKPGYDYVTGLGTPRADLLVPALVFAQ